MSQEQTQEAKSTVYTQRTTCRACGEGPLNTILDLGTQYLPRFVTDTNLDLPRAPLTLVRCGECNLLQLKHTVHPDLLFRHFWYRSGINATMQRAMHSIVEDGLRHRSSGVWLDIGANDGTLLKSVPPSFWKIAVEPASNMRPDLERVSDIVITDYFPHADVPTKKVDVLTSAAMFYDVDDPAAFVEGVARVLAPGGVWINQLNDAPTMMRTNAFDAICHEHLCYYDVPSLRRLYAKHGLAIVDVQMNDINGGSIRVTAMRTADGARKTDTLGLNSVQAPTAERFASFAVRWKKTMKDLMAGMSGPIWCYGASTKGTVLLQYLDASRNIVAVADRNPEKWGLKMVGSWLPILSEKDFRDAQPRYAMVLPWAFRREFLEREEPLITRGTNFIFPLPDIEIVA